MEENVQNVADNTQRDAEVATVKPNFELLSDVDFTSENINNTQPATEEVKQETATTDLKEEAKAPETDLSLDEEKKEETKVEDVENKEEKVEGESEESFELKLDDDGTPSSSSEDDEASWKAIARLDGIELEEDSLDAYKQAIMKPVIEELESVKSMTKESLLSDLKPEHRLYMELAEMGLSHDEIVNPTREIEKYKALDSAALYREDLLARFPNAPQEWIDAEIEKKVESGDVEHEATRIRLELDGEAQRIMQERQIRIEQYKANSEKALLEQKRNEIDTISKTLDNMPDFMGLALSTEVKKGLADRYANGKYDQAFSDPATKAKFIAFMELGDKAVKTIEAKSYMKGKTEVTKKLHNVPPLDNGGSGVQTRSMEGNFERLANDPNLQGY